MSRPMPMGPDAGGPPPSGPPAQAPSQAPANPEQMMLAQITAVLKRVATSNPAMAPGLQKALQGIMEAQSASVVGQQGPPPSQNPPV